MPRRALGICAESGCHRTTRERRCPEHLVVWEREQRERAKRMASGPKRKQTGHTYGRAGWRKIRAAQLKREPQCRACGAKASHVDHITPKRVGGGDESRNLQSLCRSCHSKKTGRSDGGFGNARR